MQTTLIKGLGIFYKGDFIAVIDSSITWEMLEHTMSELFEEPLFMVFSDLKKSGRVKFKSKSKRSKLEVEVFMREIPIFYRVLSNPDIQPKAETDPNIHDLIKQGREHDRTVELRTESGELIATYYPRFLPTPPTATSRKWRIT